MGRDTGLSSMFGSPPESRPLADEIGELRARRFSRHEQEHRHEQEEREGEKWKRRRDRIGRRNPADDRWCRRGGRAAEGERHAHSRPANLGREQFGVVAQAGAEASRDKEIQDQSHPEQARRTVEISQYYQEDRSREY